MNSADYIEWANEYRQQVEVLEAKLKGRRRRNRKFPTAEDRQLYENTTKILEDMRKDCLYALGILEQRAEEIKEEEENAKNTVA